MNLTSESRWLAATVLTLAAGLGIALALVRPTYNMAYFLPAPQTEPEQVLIERLGQGAGASLVFIEVPPISGAAVEQDADASASTRVAALRTALVATGLFSRVENGEQELALSSIPQALWNGRYLLTDVDWSVAGLRRSLEARVADLASLAGPEVSQLIAHDPVWATAGLLEQLALGGGGGLQWIDADGNVFLAAETRAPPFDLAAQTRAVEAIRTAWRGVAGEAPQPGLYGVGVYGARVQKTIQRESTILGIVATFAVLAIVALAYRSARLTLLGVLPLAAALLGGLLAATLVFREIHGITIAFGATLLGVVDDYPMHLFSRARHLDARATVRSLWWTLLASAATTLIAYLALIVAGSRGLAQLGVFCFAGILCALAVTCWVLPRLMAPRDTLPPEDPTPICVRLSLRAWLPTTLIAAAALAGSGGAQWNDDLGAYTPLPAELLRKDSEMRQRLGAPDVRYVVSIAGAERDHVLAATEALVAALPGAAADGLVRGWSAATTLAPSAETVARRRAALPDDTTLAARFATAASGLPFRADAFAPFFADVAAARRSDSVPPATGALADYVATHLAQNANGWRATVFLTGLGEPAAFRMWLAERHSGAALIDLKEASESLMHSYRDRLLELLMLALAGIAALLIWHTRRIGRFLWIVCTVASALLVTVAVVNIWHGSVTLFHLVSLVLVAGLGVDYCLFFSRSDISRGELGDTRHAVLASAASTAGAFAILGTSSIPLLSFIGATVAIGTAVTFVLARFGSLNRP